MNKSLPTAALVSAFLLTGCKTVNSFYKRDTGTIEPVAAPRDVYVPVTYPEDATTDQASVDPDAAPEVLAGDGPDAIQPLDEVEADPEPEVIETYVVEKGDTLGHISQKLYGTIGRTKDLVDANPGINPRRMQIGDVINVPR